MPQTDPLPKDREDRGASLAGRLSLAAPRGHALAEAVQMAFAARGTALEIVPVRNQSLSPGEGPVRLTARQGARTRLLLRDPVAMLELAEDLHPARPLHPRDPLHRAGHREALATLPRIVALLEPLTASADPRDLDLNTYLLRREVGLIAARLCAQTPDGDGLSLLDVAAAPLLWRIDALDRQFGAHLLTGLDLLRDRMEWQARHPGMPPLPDPLLIDDWLAALAAQGGLLTQADGHPDWSGALGPEGVACHRRDSGLPPAGAAPKLRSVGGHRGLWQGR